MKISTYQKLIALTAKAAIGIAAILILMAFWFFQDLTRHFLAGNFGTGWYTMFFFTVAVLALGVVTAFRWALLKEIQTVNERLEEKKR